MKLRHCTPRRNLESIRQHGLLLSYAQCRPISIWLHAKSKTPGIKLHVAKRHAVAAEEIVTIEVSIPRSWLRKSRWRGLYHIEKDVPPDRIHAVVDEVADLPW
jgi:hypothetical protein